MGQFFFLGGGWGFGLGDAYGLYECPGADFGRITRPDPGSKQVARDYCHSGTETRRKAESALHFSVSLWPKPNHTFPAGAPAKCKCSRICAAAPENHGCSAPAADPGRPR